MALIPMIIGGGIELRLPDVEYIKDDIASHATVNIPITQKPKWIAALFTATTSKASFWYIYDVEKNVAIKANFATNHSVELKNDAFITVTDTTIKLYNPSIAERATQVLIWY